MIAVVQYLVSAFTPRVHAAIETFGASNSAVGSMWTTIRATFPHTNQGSQGVFYITSKIAQIILGFIGGLAVVVLLWGAIRIITGGEDGITEGKKIVLYAILGLVAAIVADAVVIYTCTLINQASGGAGSCSIFGQFATGM